MDNLLTVPEPVYIILLLCSWIAAMFCGIAFVYSIHMKKEGRAIAVWSAIFAVCILLVFLLMSGIIVGG